MPLWTASVPGVDCDPYWDDVVFLSHFDGITPTDEKGKIISGGVTSSAQALFGTKSGDGPFTVAYSADFDFPGDYTVEGACYYNGAADKVLFSTIDGVSDNWWPNRWHVGINATNKLFARFYNSNGTFSATITSSTAVPANTWFRWAVTRSGNTTRLFLNGLVEDSSTGLNASLTNSGISIGQAYPNSGVVDGYMDEVRITKGVARYTGDYDVATQAFPDSAC